MTSEQTELLQDARVSVVTHDLRCPCGWRITLSDGSAGSKVIRDRASLHFHYTWCDQAKIVRVTRTLGGAGTSWYSVPTRDTSEPDESAEDGRARVRDEE